MRPSLRPSRSSRADRARCVGTLWRDAPGRAMRPEWFMTGAIERRLPEGLMRRSIRSCRYPATWRVCRHLNVGTSCAMPRFIKDDLTLHSDAHHVREDPEAVADRLRIEMRSAVGSLRARLPEAFPRWQERRRDAAHTASDRSQ